MMCIARYHSLGHAMVGVVFIFQDASYLHEKAQLSSAAAALQQAAKLSIVANLPLVHVAKGFYF